MFFIPYELTLRNFMSFGNAPTSIRLDFESPTLIVGRNYDSAVDGQLDSNGAGKTTILNAICYALYDQIISEKKVNVDELINIYNKKDMYVSLVFSTEPDTFFKIERYRKNKAAGNNGIRILKRKGGAWSDEFESEHDITPDSVANANTMVVSILGMPFEVFVRIIAFSATHKPFLFLPAAEQTEIIEEIVGLRELSEKAETLKKKNSLDNKELERLSEINNTIKAQRNQIFTQIHSATEKEAQWETTRASNLEACRAELDELLTEEVDYDEQIELLEFVAKVDGQITGYESDKRELLSDRRAIESQLSKADEWETDRDRKLLLAQQRLDSIPEIDSESIIANLKTIGAIADSVRAKKAELAEKVSAKQSIEKSIIEKKAELTHLNDATCPYCSQHYAQAKAKAVEVLDALQSSQDKILVLDDQINVIEFDIQDMAASSESLKEGLQFNDESSVVMYSNKRNSALTELERLRTEKNPYSINRAKAETEMAEIDADLDKLDTAIAKRLKKKESALSELKFGKLQDVVAARGRVEAIRKEIDRLENESNPMSSTVAELKAIQLEETKDDEIEKLETLIEHQQFLVKLLTKKDSFVRKLLLQKSLPFLNARLRYYLDRIGFLHKVVFQEDLSVKISRLGNSIGFGMISTGQKARINLALSFSFRDMLQARHGKLKFCILDECLDTGLGNVGVTLAAKMIKAVATDEKLSMFVISHRDEIGNMFDKKLVVELRDGFSTISHET